jgi:hypothetical protein
MIWPVRGYRSAPRLPGLRRDRCDNERDMAKPYFATGPLSAGCEDTWCISRRNCSTNIETTCFIELEEQYTTQEVRTRVQA